jgi:hypothetical protein
VTALVHKLAGPHLANFVNPVGKLKAAILDVHARMGMRNVAAVDIGNA